MTPWITKPVPFNIGQGAAAGEEPPPFSGLIYEGVNSGTMNSFFSGNTPIRGIQALDVSGLSGTAITKASVFLKNSNFTAGTIYCRIYTDASSATIAESSSTSYTYSQISATPAYYDFTFTGDTNIEDDYRICIDFTYGTGYLYMSRNVNQGTPADTFGAVSYDNVESPPAVWASEAPSYLSYDIKLYT